LFDSIGNDNSRAASLLPFGADRFLVSSDVPELLDGFEAGALLDAFPAIDAAVVVAGCL